jgi:hypothetical protein
MSYVAKLVGFDRTSEQLGVELTIPAHAVSTVKQIAEVPASDPDIIGSYPLDDKQLLLIADAAHVTVDAAKFTYFLEASEPGA